MLIVTRCEPFVFPGRYCEQATGPKRPMGAMQWSNVRECETADEPLSDDQDCHFAAQAQPHQAQQPGTHITGDPVTYDTHGDAREHLADLAGAAIRGRVVGFPVKGGDEEEEEERRARSWSDTEDEGEDEEKRNHGQCRGVSDDGCKPDARTDDTGSKGGDEAPNTSATPKGRITRSRVSEEVYSDELWRYHGAQPHARMHTQGSASADEDR